MTSSPGDSEPIGGRVKRHKTELAIIVTNTILAIALITAGIVFVVRDLSPIVLITAASIVPTVAVTVSAIGILRGIRAGQQQIRAHAETSTIYLSRIAWLTKKVPDIAGSVGRSRDDLSKLVERASLAKDAEHDNINSLSAAPATAATIAIRASGPTSAGRGAGRGGERPEISPQLLKRIGTTLPDQSEDSTEPIHHRIGLLGSQPPPEALPPDSIGMSLLPGTSRALVAQSNLDVVLIDELAFDSGPWAGGLDALGTSLFIELWDVLRYLRAAGVVVALMKQGRPTSHFTAELESQCSLILHSGEYDLGLGDGVGLPILDHLLNEAQFQETER